VAATRRSLFVVVRWSVLMIGVALVAYCFVRLVEVHDRAALAAPWWWLGLIGVALTLLGLGSPWPARGDGDVES
jgi:hypothetical protein